MLSFNRAKNRMVLTKYLCSVEKDYQIDWRQDVIKTGKIYGIGSFTYKKISEKRRGDWAKTLQKRIKAKREKKKIGGVIKEK